MAREITEQDLANKGVSGLPDVPGLTTEAMQKKFDEISKELLVPRFNEMAKEVNEVNESLSYIDISSQFTVNSDKVRLFAYAENGMVTIDIQLGPGFNGSVNIANLNNLKYAPRITAYGFYNCTGSGADKNAYLGSYIDRVGTMYVWCDNEIAGTEHVTVLYPIQRN